MLARPGHPGGAGSMMTMQGVGRPQQTVVNNSMMIGQTGVGGIRVQGPGIGTVRSAGATQMPPGAGQNIVINQPGLRPGQPGAQITVPLQTLQNLRPGQGIPTGQAGHLLVKTETGQYQILRVGTTLPNLATSAPAGVPSVPTPTGVMSHPSSMALRPTMSPSISTPHSSAGISLPQRPMGPVVSSTPSTPTATRPTVASAVQTPGGGAAAAAAAASGTGGMGTQMTPDTAKLKCKNFLATLLRLAGEQPAVVAANVRDLIQGLIDGHVEPEVFTTKLQKELNSSPQPCLVPFLKKSLPYLQQSLLSGELSIEGVRPPPLHSPAGQALQQQRTMQQQQQQQQQSLKVQVLGSPGVQLPQRPSMVMMPPVRTMSAGVRQPVAVSAGSVSTSISNSPAVQAVISQLRPTGLGAANIRSISAPLPKSSVPSARIGSGTIQHSVSNNASSIVNSLTSNTLSSSMPSTSTPFSTFSRLPPPVMPSPKSEKKSLNVGGSYSSTGDEDINDVATMGGVNLAEESQRMQGATDMMIGTQIRSCKDETFLQTGQLQHRIARICREHGLDEPPASVVALVSHATQERLKTLLEKLNVIAEHRLDIVKSEGDYEVTQDVRGQIKFLGELDKIERKRHEEAERELLLRAAKSRTKTEDPEKEKLKAKAKELQRIEEDQLRYEKANNTALMAIGMPKKKMRLEESSATSAAVSSAFGAKPMSGVAARPRTKRVHLRDLLFLMEQEKELKRSPLLWKAYSS